jgi:hypothetical protein
MTSFSFSLIPSLQHTGSWFWTLSNQLAWQSNESKSHLQFTRLLTHLGFVIDLDSGSFEVPQERRESLQQLITVALSRQKVLVHLPSRIAGHLSNSFCSLVVMAEPYASHDASEIEIISSLLQL